MMIGKKVGFTRWYDRVPELSQAVRMMEKLPERHQVLIARVIIEATPMHAVTERKEGVKNMGSDKVMGLLKSKSKKRWYDQDPTVHQAFNYLYLMNDVLRYEVAMKMIIAMNALERAAGDPRFFNKDPVLVESIFNYHLMELMDKTGFAKPDEPAAEAPAEEPVAVQGANAVDVSGESLKLVHLKME